MGHEQRMTEAMDAEAFRDLFGTVYDFGEQFRGCKFCGSLGWGAVQFCRGGSILDPRRRDLCPINDPEAQNHVHFMCPCGAHLITYPKDDARNSVHNYTPQEIVHAALAYLMRIRGDEHPGYVLSIDNLQLKELESERFVLDDKLDGYRRIRLLTA